MKKIQLENLQESVYVFLAVVIGVLLFGILLYFIVCNNAKQYEYISCGVFFISFLVLFIYIICQLMRISKIGLRASCIKIHEEYIEIVYKKGIEIVDKIKIYNENIDEVLIEFNLPFFSYEEYLKMKFSKMDEILQTDINLQKIQEELFATNFNYFSSNFKKYMSEVECKVGFPKASIAVDFLIKLSNETKILHKLSRRLF